MEPLATEPLVVLASASPIVGELLGEKWIIVCHSATGYASEALGESDDDALGAAEEAQPVDVLVLRDLADELAAVGAQAGDYVVDVLDREHDAADAQRVRRRVLRLCSDRRRRVELRQLDPAVAVRGPHHGDVAADSAEPDDLIGPRSLVRRLAFQL